MPESDPQDPASRPIEETPPGAVSEGEQLRARVRQAAKDFEFGTLLSGTAGTGESSTAARDHTPPPSRSRVQIVRTRTGTPLEEEVPPAFRTVTPNGAPEARAEEEEKLERAMADYWSNTAPPIPPPAKAVVSFVPEQDIGATASRVAVRTLLVAWLALMAFTVGLAGSALWERVDYYRAALERGAAAATAGAQKVPVDTSAVGVQLIVFLAVAAFLALGVSTSLRVIEDDLPGVKQIFWGTSLLLGAVAIWSGTSLGTAKFSLDSRVSIYNGLLDTARIAQQEARSTQLEIEKLRRSTSGSATAATAKTERAKWEEQLQRESRTLQSAQSLLEGLRNDPRFSQRYRAGERCLLPGQRAPRSAGSLAANLVYYRHK